MGKDSIEFIQKGCSLLAYHARWNAQPRKGMLSRPSGCSKEIPFIITGETFDVVNLVYLMIYFVVCHRDYQGYIIENRFNFMVSDYLSLWTRNIYFKYIVGRNRLNRIQLHNESYHITHMIWPLANRFWRFLLQWGSKN